MNQTITPIPVWKPRTWRRRLLHTLLFLVVFAVGGMLWFLWYSFHDLNALMVEMDVQDPGWRLHDIEASRKTVPGAENSALHIVAVAKSKSLPNVITPDMANLPPQVELNEKQSLYLELDFGIHRTAVVESRKLKDMPQGRYPIKYSDDSISTPMSHLHDALGVCELLKWDAARRVQANDDEGALESCLALQNAARSMGDEPCYSSLMFRGFCHNIAVGAIERTLAQGRFAPSSEPVLKRMQEAIVQELAAPKVLIVLRGHRAGLHRFVQAMAEGKVSAATFKAVGNTVDILDSLLGRRTSRMKTLDNEIAGTLMEHLPAYLTRQHAAMLRFANDAVEAAKLPPEKADERFQALENRIREEPYLVRITGASFIEIREAERRMHANLRSAVAALAAERFRLAHKRWPDALDDLVKAGFLDAVPTDPYDGKPIRLKRVADGLVLYSVGRDKIDNDGFMNREHAAMVHFANDLVDDNPADPGTDIGFRLWDISARRQAPNPPVKKEKPAK
jgi:hypothetical protein